MHLTFQSELLDLDPKSAVPVGRNEDCMPKYYDGDWVWDVTLGHCGMRISNFDKDDEQWVYY